MFHLSSSWLGLLSAGYKCSPLCCPLFFGIDQILFCSPPWPWTWNSLYHLFFNLFIWARVSLFSHSWSGTCYTKQAGTKVMVILLSLPTECWNYMCHQIWLSITRTANLPMLLLLNVKWVTYIQHLVSFCLNSLWYSLVVCKVFSSRYYLYWFSFCLHAHYLIIFSIMSLHHFCRGCKQY